MIQKIKDWWKKQTAPLPYQRGVYVVTFTLRRNGRVFRYEWDYNVLARDWRSPKHRAYAEIGAKEFARQAVTQYVAVNESGSAVNYYPASDICEVTLTHIV